MPQTGHGLLTVSAIVSGIEFYGDISGAFDYHGELIHELYVGAS
jgi:hypothetical protein